jgi:CelD/BcsL family acetyltransferase involved in cellulose biosynthesis
MDREHRSAAPSNAVIRAAIESGCERGLGFFDFGASGPLLGVQAFKEAFGAQERTYTASTFRTQRFRVGDAAIRSIRSARGKRT